MDGVFTPDHPQEGREKIIRRFFVVSVWLKAIDGVVEIAAGIAVLFVGPLMRFANALIQNELLEDPRDLVANYLQHFLPVLVTHADLFALTYLIVHGVVKVFLVVGLLRYKRWAYPSAVVVFALFAAYQLYLYTIAPSAYLIILTALDLVVIGLTWHEYRYVQKYHAFPAQ